MRKNNEGRTPMKTVVAIPCYNEELTIEKVVRDFARELPEAEIIVMDNCSTDASADIARRAGARVVPVARRGKGAVVREIFRKIDADIYVMVDGDDACPAEAVHSLMSPVIEGVADMVIGDRHSGGDYEKHNTRAFHGFGNKLVAWLVYFVFGARHDVMSGYRVLNSFAAKNIPILSDGFEVETEMTIYALARKFNVVGVPYPFRDRPKGNEPKLNTFQDGGRVLKTIFTIIKDYRPLLFFSFFSGLFFLLGIFFGFPVLREFAETGKVSLAASAVLATGMMILSALSIFCGLILDTIVVHQRQESEIRLIQFCEKGK